ncbi:hypothetical protein [Pseudoduganella violaceinigra]|uniref:hypothetical protein n=1 Tax=Pseudoduganella violaceinigra TaxID=246602 RepID=UPI00041B5BFD|nr:hypothetical protein [Pseudoduganella violaceinigra]
MNPSALPIRLKHWGACCASFLLTLVIHQLILAKTGLSIFSFQVYAFIPVGAAVVGLCAVSGYILSPRRLQREGDRIDFAFLILLCLSVQFGAEMGSYLAWMFSHGMALPDISPGRYFALKITNAEYAFSDGPPHGLPATPVKTGQFGWFLLLPRFAFLLAVAKVAWSTHARDQSYT